MYQPILDSGESDLYEILIVSILVYTVQIHCKIIQAAEEEECCSAAGSARTRIEDNDSEVNA